MSLQKAVIKNRSTATLNAYLILRKKDHILLSIRKNTGYYDDYYSLIAGHVEEGEAATAAIIREAQEEAGIMIFSDDLRVVHIMHRKTNRNNMDIFFECSAWSFDIINKEPEKCAGLAFHPLGDLPSKIVPYVLSALHASINHSPYSEEGWSSD